MNNNTSPYDQEFTPHRGNRIQIFNTLQFCTKLVQFLCVHKRDGSFCVLIFLRKTQKSLFIQKKTFTNLWISIIITIFATLWYT